MQSMQENRCKDTPVIVLTANAIIGAKEQYMQIGFTDYLSKPIDSHRLENLIVEQLALHNIHVEPIELSGNSSEVYGEKNHEALQELPQVEGFDWEYGLLHFPNAQMLWESVEDFYNGCESAVAELDLLYQDISGPKGMDAYRIKVHALKSNLALIGAMQASALAKILEYAARDGKEERLRYLHGVLMEEVEACRRNLSAHMQQAKKKQDMTDQAWILGMLSMMRADVENLDYDGMDQIVQMLDAYAYEDKLQIGINRLVDSVRNLDLDTSMSICDQMKDMLEKG